MKYLGDWKEWAVFFFAWFMTIAMFAAFTRGESEGIRTRVAGHLMDGSTVTVRDYSSTFDIKESTGGKR